MSGSTPGRVLVTGATGFIGRRLITHLLDAGSDVRVLVRPSTAGRAALDRRCEVRVGALTDGAAVAAAIAGVDAVVYAAGAVRGRALEHFHEANVAGVETVASVLRRLPDAPGVVLLSSLAASRPDVSHYAASKHAGERVLRDGGLPRWAVLRPPAVYGPGDVELAPLFDLARRGLVVRPGPHRQRLSLIHVDDLCRAVVACLANIDACRGQTFELHDGRPGGYDWDAIGRTLAGRRPRQLAVPGWALAAIAHVNLAVATVTGRQPMLTPGKARELRQPAWVCDNRAFTGATGWAPRIDLATGAATQHGAPVPAKDDTA